MTSLIFSDFSNEYIRSLFPLNVYLLTLQNIMDSIITNVYFGAIVESSITFK